MGSNKNVAKLYSKKLRLEKALKVIEKYKKARLF